MCLSMKKKTATDWHRLTTMSDDEIDTTEIPELDQNFFEQTELTVPFNHRFRLRLQSWLQLWFFWIPALTAFFGTSYWLWLKSSLWNDDPLLALASAAFTALLVAVICFCIRWGWGD